MARPARISSIWDVSSGWASARRNVTWMPRMSAISRSRRGTKMANANTRGTVVTMMARISASRWIPCEPACPAEINESPECVLSASAVR